MGPAEVLFHHEELVQDGELAMFFVADVFKYRTEFIMYRPYNVGAIENPAAAMSPETNYTRPYFESVNGMKTALLSEAELMFKGEIKYDGCSNWDFLTHEVMWHFCNAQQAVNLGLFIKMFYNYHDKWAAELAARTKETG